MNVKAIFFALVLLAVLSGCGSSPPVDYYTLQPIKNIERNDPDNASLLGIGPIRIPGYIDRPQLVTQRAGRGVKVDEFNRWAEPLDLAIPRIVTVNVDGLLDDVIAVTFPYPSRFRTDYRLIGRIIRFDADEQGLAVLELQWAVQDADATNVIQPRRDRYTAQATSTSDSNAIVVALNDTLEAFSRDVADIIRAEQAAQD